jgi:hypothetical protein
MANLRKELGMEPYQEIHTHPLAKETIALFDCYSFITNDKTALEIVLQRWADLYNVEYTRPAVEDNTTVEQPATILETA